MANVIDVANVFLKLSDPDSGDTLTNLKLQKLVYYVQGFHKALYDAPMFDEKILHWEHGPVVRELYDALRSFKKDSVPVPENFEATMFTQDQLDLIEEINKVYGQFSAWKLRDMTHAEEPWKNTKKDEEITLDALGNYFKAQLA